MKPAGLYLDMPTEEYFSDPAQEPSLTQSLAKILLEQSPLHAWMAHPRLNPAFQRDDEKKFDIGSVAHALLLGRGKDIVPIDFGDWRTKAAREAREAAAADFKLAVKRKDYDLAVGMAGTARSKMKTLGLFDVPVHAEAVIMWQESGLWCRTMIDALERPSYLTVFDYKTTAASAAPSAIPAKMVNDGWDIQAAFHSAALDSISPETAGKRRHIFICQENYEPYACGIYQLDEATMTMGRKKMLMALELWDRCIKSNQWPAYPDSVIRPQYPTWAENEWIAREMRRE